MTNYSDDEYMYVLSCIAKSQLAHYVYRRLGFGRITFLIANCEFKVTCNQKIRK